LKFKYFRYTDTLAPGSVNSPYPYAWGAYDVSVLNKGTGLYEPLNLTKTYNVGTNEFLAPAGGDSYNAFKYMTNVTYWGDMLNAVNAYVSAHYGTPATAYAGPNGNGTLDGRIAQDGMATLFMMLVKLSRSRSCIIMTRTATWSRPRTLPIPN
jgi:2',3'-cyclic-nucleotide 2'-phosphodiesterase (5'-nucleotidase family)